MKKAILIIFAIILGNKSAFATIEDIGNLTQVIVPAYAFGMAVNEDGWDGTKEFITQFAAMELAVNALKLTIHEQRPDASDHMSFPSGHSAAAFSGAAFIHKRYGFRRAIIPYLAAGFTGFSRIHANRHHTHDVIAGALIGGLIGYFMTSRKESNFDTSAEISPDGAKLNFKATF